MAQLKCGFCQGTSFGVSTEQLTDARYPLSVVRCLTCNAPFGVLPLEDPVAVTRAIGQALADRLQQTEDRLKSEIADIRDRFPSP